MLEMLQILYLIKSREVKSC